MGEDRDTNNGIVTIEVLRKLFTSDAWKPLHQDDSRICRMLQHPCFKNDVCLEPSEISSEYLISLAILLCQGKPRDKAVELYNVLQDGGLTHHQYISANDKDLPRIFEKMSGFVTYYLYEWMNSTIGFEHQYTDDEIELLKSSHEQFLEDKFLDDVYGSQSRLENEVWLKQVISKASYMFSAVDLRAHLHKNANVKMRE